MRSKQHVFSFKIPNRTRFQELNECSTIKKSWLYAQLALFYRQDPLARRVKLSKFDALGALFAALLVLLLAGCASKPFEETCNPERI